MEKLPLQASPSWEVWTGKRTGSYKLKKYTQLVSLLIQP